MRANEYRARMSREDAIELLARKLYDKMEHLSPIDGGDWESLSVHQQEFHRLCVEELLMDEELLRRAIDGAVNEVSTCE
jgi:hypothetical protein